MSEKAMLTLQDRLDEFRKAFESGAPPYNARHEVIEKMHRATASELKASGIEQQALKIGDRAPSFTYSIRTTWRCPPAPSSNDDVRLSASSGDTGDLIARWGWRLYKESILKPEHWERTSSCSLLDLNGIRGLCIKKLNLTFDMLTDLHLETAEQFRLLFTLPDYLRDLYKSFGNALDRFHDEPEYRLPIPARYVVDKQGSSGQPM